MCFQKMHTIEEQKQSEVRGLIDVLRNSWRSYYIMLLLHTGKEEHETLSVAGETFTITFPCWNRVFSQLRSQNL